MMNELAIKMNQLLELNVKVYGQVFFGEYTESYIELQMKIYDKGYLHCYDCKEIVDVSSIKAKHDIHVNDCYKCSNCIKKTKTC